MQGIIATRVPWIATAAALLVTAILLSTNRLQYCGQAESSRPRVATVVTAEMRGPTLAPPQKVVFVQVETDKPDLEIGWLEN